MTHKLIDQLERDVRNQARIDQMKRLNTKGKFMVYLNRNYFGLLFSMLVIFWVLLAVKARAFECPTPGEACKFILLSPTEERILMQPNGVLDTAAQARNLDLGQFVVYLKTRISNAPQGDVKPVEPPKTEQLKTPENKSVPPVDNSK